MSTKTESKDSPWVYVEQSGIHNTGLFARKDIPKGTKIIEFKGEKITKEEAIRRIEEDPVKEDLMHIFELDEKYDIDGGSGGSDAIYFNHSCDPNCEVDDEGGELWFYAIKDIKEGEELTFDYNCGCTMQLLEEPCRCGSKNCRGCIVSEEDLDALRRVLAKESLSRTDIKFLEDMVGEEDITPETISRLKELLRISIYR